jgi:hypothetical protein
MKNKLWVLLIAVIAISLLSGCSQRVGDFTIVSTKNVEIGGKYKKLDSRFKAEDRKPMILGIPIGIPNLKTAVDNCIEAGKGELLTNAVLDASFWTIFFFGEQWYTATGDVWARSEIAQDGEELFELAYSPTGYELVSLSDPLNRIKVDYQFASK